MANEIVTDQTIPAQFKNDGDILYGRDINQIVAVFKEAVNALKKDIDTIISGDSNVIVKYSLAELENETAIVGTYAFVYLSDGLKLYIKEDPNWVFVREISLITAMSATEFDSITVDGRLIDWNDVEGTFDVQLNNEVTLHLGQQQMFYAKAYQGDITIGDPVMFAGVEGNHFRIKVADPEVINQNPEYFIGVATQNIDSGEFGYVVEFGMVRNVNLPIAEYASGDVLWFDSLNGGLTKIKPDRGNAWIRVAAVIKPNQNNQQLYTGTIFVRPNVLEDVEGLKIYIQSEEPADALNGDLWYKII
jgi:hypothetical protein